MISEGSCDTEDWSNECFSFAITALGLKYKKKNILLFYSIFD